MLSYTNCHICPRNCSVNRSRGEKGYCRQNDEIMISTAALHFGEEPLITGKKGSGTIFFSGCTMGCPFCQNWQISRGLSGAKISVDTLCDIILELQNRGAENINFVTGTHFFPSIKGAVEKAKQNGLSIPLVWNCSGYETHEAIDELNTFIDIYLPDYKTSSDQLAKKLFLAEDYPLIAEKAILKMAESRPLSLSDEGIMKSGVIIRHLVLPGELESSRGFFKWYSENLKGKALLSIMVQYTPVEIPGNKIEIPERYVSQQEYDEILDYLEEFGIEEGFFQDLDQGNDWLPNFDNKIPFPSKETKVIWSSVSGGFV